MAIFYDLSYFGTSFPEGIEVIPVQGPESFIRWFSSEGEVDPSTIQFSGENEWEHM